MRPTNQAPHRCFAPHIEIRVEGEGSGIEGLLAVGVRIRGTLGDIDPLNKVPVKRPRNRVQKGPL